MLEQARELAARIVSTWAGGPTAEVWIEELVLLDEGPAGTAFVRLRRELERAPSVRRFLEAYRSLHTTRAPVRVECSRCDGSGWFERTEHGPGCPRRKGATACACTAVLPCSCPAGAQYEDTYRAIGRANRWPSPAEVKAARAAEAGRQGELL